MGHFRIRIFDQISLNAVPRAWYERTAAGKVFSFWFVETIGTERIQCVLYIFGGTGIAMWIIEVCVQVI